MNFNFPHHSLANWFLKTELLLQLYPIPLFLVQLEHGHPILYIGSSQSILPTPHFSFYVHLTSSLDVYIKFMKWTNVNNGFFSLGSSEDLCCSILFSFQAAEFHSDTWVSTLGLLSGVSQPAPSHSAIRSICSAAERAPLWGNTIQLA